MKNNLPATKADLEKFITKKEFKVEVAKLVTKKEFKAELAKLATKEELKAEVAKLATKEELKTVERVLRAEIRVTADEIKSEIREEIKQSSSKILDVLDGFLVEMRTSEEERTIAAHQISNHDDRISVLEQKVGIAAA